MAKETQPMVPVGSGYPFELVEAQQKQDVEKKLVEIQGYMPDCTILFHPAASVLLDNERIYGVFPKVDILSWINNTPIGPIVFPFTGGLLAESEERKEIREKIDDLKKTYFEETKLKVPEKEGSKEIPLKEFMFYADLYHKAHKSRLENIKNKMKEGLKKFEIEEYSIPASDALDWFIPYFESKKEEEEEKKDENKKYKEYACPYFVSFHDYFGPELAGSYKEDVKAMKEIHKMIKENPEAALKYDLMKIERILDRYLSILEKITKYHELLVKKQQT